MGIDAEVATILREKENLEVSGPVSSKAIVELERTLGVEVSGQYRDFLLEFGSAVWFGNSIYGIGEGPYPDFENLDAVRQTEEYSSTDYPSEFEPFPSGVVMLSRYQGGGAFLLFCEPGEHAGMVALREDDQLGKLVQWWPDFNTWVRWLR